MPKQRRWGHTAIFEVYLLNITELFMRSKKMIALSYAAKLNQTLCQCWSLEFFSDFLGT
ncbi:hypothetical protein X777_00602 [Ooceraea biroi]|uniref:Uncharacterized protein n=1 Tax=Ooceraea biroi TaxID=2015173 RepID=A0A026X4B2_OOCBI|nr:hypothetical protein X777_00602 [Ooceraea biroi]